MGFPVALVNEPAYSPGSRLLHLLRRHGGSGEGGRGRAGSADFGVDFGVEFWREFLAWILR